MKILNLKNLFTKKEKKINFNRRRAEKEQERALSLGKPAHSYGGFRDRNLQAIYSPPRKKLKGYQKENRRCTFNKNR